MACTLGNVSKSTNCDNSGGLVKLLYAAISDLLDTTPGQSEITWTGEEITDIVKKTGKQFYTIEFDEDTAFFQQSRNVPRKGTSSWTQQVQFFISRMNETTRKGLQDMENCANCDGIIMVVVDSNNEKHVLGVSYDGSTEHIIKKMRPAAGATDTTGADPTADANLYQEIYEVNNAQRARFYNGTVAALLTPGT